MLSKNQELISKDKTEKFDLLVWIRILQRHDCFITQLE